MHNKQDTQSKNLIKNRKPGRPRKSLAQLSPAYRNRLQSGKAKGLSRSQAYGHPRQKEASAIAVSISKPFLPQSSTLTKSFKVAQLMKNGESMTQQRWKGSVLPLSSVG